MTDYVNESMQPDNAIHMVKSVWEQHMTNLPMDKIQVVINNTLNNPDKEYLTESVKVMMRVTELCLLEPNQLNPKLNKRLRMALTQFTNAVTVKELDIDTQALAGLIQQLDALINPPVIVSSEPASGDTPSDANAPTSDA